LILNSWLHSEATTNKLSLLSSFLDVGYAYRQYCHPSWKAPFLAVVLVTLGLTRDPMYLGVERDKLSLFQVLASSMPLQIVGSLQIAGPMPQS